MTEPAPSTRAPAWLRNAIVEGLQALLVLRLKGAPSHDTAKALANAWVAVIASRPIAWNEARDVPRIRQAFVELAATCEQWPAPAALLRVLPTWTAPASAGQLPKPTSRVIPPAAREILDRFLRRTKQ